MVSTPEPSGSTRAGVPTHVVRLPPQAERGLQQSVVAERGFVDVGVEHCRNGIDQPSQSSPPWRAGLMGDSWSKPRMITPNGPNTIEYASPLPLRITAAHRLRQDRALAVAFCRQEPGGEPAMAVQSLIGVGSEQWVKLS